MSHCPYCLREVGLTKSGRIKPHGLKQVKYVGKWSCPGSLSDGVTVEDRVINDMIDHCNKRMDKADQLNNAEAADAIRTFHVAQIELLASWLEGGCGYEE